MNGLTLACEVENISTRVDGSTSVKLGLPELNPDQIGKLYGFRKQAMVCYFSPKEITRSEIEKVDKVDVDLGGKTQSQRIRNTLYKLFDHDNEGFKTFDEFYKSKTEKYIEFLKSKIEQ